MINRPGFANVNLSLFRSFQATGRFKAEFRAETFNFTHQSQYPNLDNSFDNATFGQITHAGIGSSADGGSRNIQFGLRLLF